MARKTDVFFFPSVYFGPRRDLPRRRGRHARLRGYPHRAGRHDIARRGRGAGLGQNLRFRVLRARGGRNQPVAFLGGREASRRGLGFFERHDRGGDSRRRGTGASRDFGRPRFVHVMVRIGRLFPKSDTPAVLPVVRP